MQNSAVLGYFIDVMNITLVNVYVDLVHLRVLPVLHRPEVVVIGVTAR